MRCSLITLLSALLAGGSSLAAQDGDLFDKLDANKDGIVAADEVPAEQKLKFEQLLKIAGKETDQKLGRALFHAALAQAAKAERAAAPRPQPPMIDAAGLFAKLDVNQDGFVTGEEVAEPQKALFERLVRTSDGDGDRKLSNAEFRAGLAPQAGLPGLLQLSEQFDRLDANKDGKLTREEVPEERQFMRRLFERADVTSLTKEQFLRVMPALAQGGGQPGAPPRRPDGGPPGMAALAAIDANRDGELSKEEIESAAKALLTLDRNGDGQLTRDELVGPDRRPR